MNLRHLIIACLVGYVQAATAQEEAAVETWFDVPSTDAALAIVVEAKAPISLVVMDAKRSILDELKWEFPVPLLRQYRVDPGTYEIRLNDAKDPILVELRDGTLTFLKLGPEHPEDGVESGFYPASFKPIRDQSEQLVQGLSLKGLGKQIAPKHLDPATKELYLGTDAPWEIPFPPQPSPTPPPKD